MKKFRKPKAAPPNTLKVLWGSSHGKEDMFYVWGPGCSASDGRLFNTVLFQTPTFSHKNLIEDLKARGYDITTLRITVKKANSARINC